MNNHECIIGIWYDYGDTQTVTVNELKQKVSNNFAFCGHCISEELQLYNTMHSISLSDYFDFRKSTNLSRFDYCPVCGKKLDWKQMKKENKQ